MGGSDGRRRAWAAASPGAVRYRTAYRMAQILRLTPSLSMSTYLGPRFGLNRFCVLLSCGFAAHDR